MSNGASTIIDVDRVIHEPARLLILTTLVPVEEADFTYLLRETGLTKGNLSSHLSKLEKAGYVEIEKTYQGKLPLTLCRLTPAGRTAFEEYRQTMHAFVLGLSASGA
ncbi:MAG: winged helix-turn-helix domain-containing protein [Caldilineaceae bacterium]